MKTILTIVIYVQMFKQMDTMMFYYRRVHLIRVRPRARFCVIFHTKILKNARKSRARVWKTHVEKEKRMTIMYTRLCYKFINIIKPLVRMMCLYFKVNSTLEFQISVSIFFKNRSRLRRSY